MSYPSAYDEGPRFLPLGESKHIRFLEYCQFSQYYCMDIGCLAKSCMLMLDLQDVITEDGRTFEIGSSAGP